MDIFKSWLATRPVAHRGLHNDKFPENTLAAFSNAIDKNFPIEIDVRITDDNQVVVFHDDKLSRLTESEGYVCNTPLDELKKLKIRKSDETIPTFKEVLDLVSGKVPLLIEIKNGNKIGNLEKLVIEELKGYEGEFAVQSFNPMSMDYFRHNAPHIIRGQLSCFFKDSDISRLRRYVLKRMLLNGYSQPDFIAYDGTTLPNRYVSKYFNKKPILAWTVRSNTELETVFPYCNNIIFEGFIPELDVKE